MIRKIALWNILVLVELLLICGAFLTLSFSREETNKGTVLVYVSIVLIITAVIAIINLFRSTYKILALDMLDLKQQKNGVVVSMIIAFMILAIWIFRTFIFNGAFESSWMDLVFLVPIFTIALLAQASYTAKLPQTK